jgi:hypothetical protein
MVSRSNDQNILVLLEAIHLGQNLVDSGSTRTPLSTFPPSLGEQRVNLINEDDAGTVLPGLLE